MTFYQMLRSIEESDECGKTVELVLKPVWSPGARYWVKGGPM